MLKIRSICTTLIGGKIYDINGRTIREEKLLSEGAYSFVYMAKDLNTNKAYTIKKTICQNKEKLDMANKEINILRSLPPHKNIIQYYGSTIISENNHKIVIMLMEFCERGNLLNIFEQNKDKLREYHIVKILKDIITGLSFLHSQEIPITHRDIKLENVLCDKKGVYKICDFGSHSISKSIYPNDLMKNSLFALKEDIERDTTLIYRPPELIDLYSNLEISCKVDMWMSGCILYLLLYKVHPFQNSSFLSVLNGSFTIPYNVKYSKRIISILLMTLNKNPVKRIDSSTLLFILENYADLKKWFTFIPSDIKKKVNQIFYIINELNSSNAQNNLIEINNDKIVDLKIASPKCAEQPPKNNISFLKFFRQNNISSYTLKKNKSTNDLKKKSNITENILIENKNNDIVEKKNENIDNKNNDNNKNRNNDYNSNKNIDKNNNNIKENKDIEDAKDNIKLEENIERNVNNKMDEVTVENIKKEKNISDNIGSECKGNENLLNLDIEHDKTIENNNDKNIYIDDKYILKDLSLNNEIDLIDFNNSSLSNEKFNSNNFDNFFDPWNDTKNDLFGIDTSIQKNSDNYFFEDNENEIYKDKYFSIDNFTENVKQPSYKDYSYISNNSFSVDYLEKIENKELNNCNINNLFKTNSDINFADISKSKTLNDAKKKNISQLIKPDKNDIFSELLDEFQNLSVQ